MSMRPAVRKTYKLFIGGQFPRSESGRSYCPSGAPAINVTRASRKDLRDAVTAARAALPEWAARSGYNRGQILYRLAEILETRKDSLVAEIRACTSATAARARREVEAAIDLTTWYAGLPDKLTALCGSQNGVSGPFFNFSSVEPTGVVAAVAPEQPALCGLLAVVLPLLAGSNTVVALTSGSAPLPGLALGEICAVSDVPAGVVNLLAGERGEILPQMASHRDVDGLLVAGSPDPEVGGAAADSVKRVRFADLAESAWARPREVASLRWVEPFVEVKTFWHPVAY